MNAIELAAQAVPLLARWAEAVERYWNDLFNDSTRRIHSANGERDLPSPPNETRSLTWTAIGPMSMRGSVSSLCTAAIACLSIALGLLHVRGAWVVGADGKRYALVANFSQQGAMIPIADRQLSVPAGEAQLVELADP